MDKNARVVLATSNRGKVAELAGALGASGIEVLGLDAFPGLPEVEETGATFAENALLKARAAAAGTGLVAVADDSGLTVDALGGAPGIYSARYGDDLPMLPGETRDDRNIRKLLAALREVPEAARGGCFHCAMAAAYPDGTAILAEGVWAGQVLAARRGTNGFGYDPVFFDPALGRAAAELSRAEKMAVSHRARALRALLAQWPAFWQGRPRAFQS